MLLRLISVGAIFVGALSALPSAVGAQGAIVTGCLTQTGRIVKVAVGEEPARPCGPRETQVSWRLAGDDEEGGPERVDFLLTMERDGPEETIATNGPLEVLARCHTHVTSHRFVINVTSDVDGWWISGGRQVPVIAGEEIVLFSKDDAAGTTQFFAGTDLGGEALSAIAPDGSFIAIERHTLGYGVNILGHDCIAVGTATLKQVDLQ